jgi:endonuclease/exonuclease/phosphatase family metal-dependent hydrolase
VRLDYVFVPLAFRERLIACEVVRDGEVTTASDHLPVLADFALDGPGSTS